jgi:HK97 gp10 family phage protein
MKGGITEYGYVGFDKAVDKFERHMIKELKRIVKETAEMMASQMKALAPVAEVDGGNLKNSIDVTYFNRGLSAMITVGASYAVYVEYGTGIYTTNPEYPGRQTPWVYYSEKLNRWVWTRGMRAQPFFKPSYEIASKHFKDEMNKLGA